MFSAISPRSCSSAVLPTRSVDGRRACRRWRSGCSVLFCLRRRKAPDGCSPRAGRAVFPPGLPPARPGFATFSLIGFYAALIPSLLGETLHQSAPLVAGAVVGELFLIAAVAILASGALASQTATLTALLLLPPSVWILVSAEVAHSLALLLFAAAVSGLAGGLGYR